jgi:hypothetical protein
MLSKTSAWPSKAHPDLRRRYDELAKNLRDWVVNNWTGMYVSDITAMKATRQVPAKRTRLVKGYRRLSR